MQLSQRVTGILCLVVVWGYRGYPWNQTNSNFWSQKDVALLLIMDFEESSGLFGVTNTLSNPLKT